jgi:hypothetical protein
MPDRKQLHHQVGQIAPGMRYAVIRDRRSDHYQTGSSLGRATLIVAHANTG